MAKDDVSAKTLLAWDEIMGKPFDQALPEIYSHAGNISGAKRTWYWKSIKKKRFGSLSVRLFTFILLIIGTVLPILAGLGKNPELRLLCTQLGVVALAVAGLLQIADRIFGLSSGWLRYITTVTLMENLTRKFELDWAGYIADKGSNIGNDDTKKLFDIARQFEDDISKLQSDETDRWVAEFNSGVALLSELIKSQRESAEKTAADAYAASASQKNGSIEVNIIHKAAPEPVNISVDNDAPEKGFVGSSWARRDLKPGQHTISVKTTGGTPQTIQKVVEVPQGGVARAEVKLS